MKLFFLSACLGVFVFAIPPGALAQNASGESAPLEFTPDGGFCLEGTFPWFRSELAARIDNVVVWGSWCTADANTGRIESARFFAPSTLSFYLSGYIGSPGLRLFVRNLESGHEFNLRPASSPGDQWQLSTFELPPDWQGKIVQIIGEDRATAVYGWFAFTAPVLPYSVLAAGDIPTDSPQTGFCTKGEFSQVGWAGGRPPGIAAWRSYCDSGDNDVGWMASAPFVAGSFASFYVAGYPGSPGIRLALENVRTKQQLPLTVPVAPAESWRLYHFPLPPHWKGDSIRLLAEDRAARPGGWVGFAEVPFSKWRSQTKFGFRLPALVLALFAVSMLPAAAACVIAVLKGVRTTLDLTAIALLTIGLVGYIAFWCYFFSRAAGLAYSDVVLFLSVATILYALLGRQNRARLGVLKPLLAPLTLVATASVCIVCLGFLYGKPQVTQDYTARRFGPPALSVDNFLPKILADDVYDGHIPKPMAGDWLSSDRPPLQAGMTLWHYAWTKGDRDLRYQILGSIFQLIFLAGLWAYLDAAGIGRKAMALVLATAFFSGFTVFNSFFVWPKLLPVAFLLIISAYVLTERYHLARAQWQSGLVVGAAAALAMLCHGGSVFGLLGLLLTLLVLRRVPSPRFLLSAALAAALLYLPWSLYQKFCDPPGDRLAKMFLAGMPNEAHPEVKLREALVSNYRNAKWYGLENKIANFEALFDATPGWGRLPLIARTLLSRSRQQQASAVALLRETMFYRWFWSLDLFSCVLGVWLLTIVFWRRRSAEYGQATILWICTGMTLIAWCLVMFGGIIVHQGCYFTEITAFTAGVLGLWALSPRLAALIVTCHILFTFAIYVSLSPPRPVGIATYFGPPNTVLASFSALAAAAFILVCPVSFGALEDGTRRPVSSQCPAL